MKTNTRVKCTFFLFGIAAMLSIVSCSKEHAGGSVTSVDTLGYRVLTVLNSTNIGQGLFLLPVDTLTGGSVSPVNYGYDLSGTIPHDGLYYHKGYYYFIQNNELYKYKIDKATNQFTKVGGVVFTYFSSTALPIDWVDDHTAVFIGSHDSIASYAIIDVDDMTTTAGGKLDIPFYSGPTLRDPSTNGALTPSFNIFFYKVEGSKAVVGYTYDTYPEIPGTTDINYYAEMDYPSMQNVTIKTASRSEYFQPMSYFSDENGNYYLPTANRWWGGDNTRQEGVIRINKGEYLPDPSYFLSITKFNQNNEFDIVSTSYIGNGKAFLGGDGQYNTYLLIDVNTQTELKNLGDTLPQNPWAFLPQNYSLADNGKLYFADCGDNGGIYRYDPATDQLTRGTQFTGGVFGLELFHKVENE